MTEPTNPAADRGGVPAPADAQVTARLRSSLDRLSAAAQAVKLANDTAQDAQQTIREAGLDPSDILRNWRATNMLMYAALNNLDAEVHAIEGLLRATLLRR